MLAVIAIAAYFWSRSCRSSLHCLIVPGVQQTWIGLIHLQALTFAADTNGSGAKLARDAEPQWFLAGATTTCILRAQAIPDRVFHDFDAGSEASPWDVMQRAGEWHVAVVY